MDLRVSAVNPPVDGSNIPEEPSSPEGDPEGGVGLAGGAELSEVESLVLVAVVAVSVVFVSVEEVSVELVSVEDSPAEPVSVEIPAKRGCSDIRGARDRRVGQVGATID
jgi:hypothetical protein